MYVPLPSRYTKIIANRALESSRKKAKALFSKNSTGRGMAAVYPIAEDGYAGLGIPSDVKYILYQEKGTKPRLMTELEGKTIPIRGADGKIHYRVAKNVGAWVPMRDESGQIIGEKQSWKHPGIKGKFFLEDALKEEVSAFIKRLTPDEKAAIIEEAKKIGKLDQFLKRK